MNNKFAEIQGIGELAYKKLYGFYSVPLLFSCTSLKGNLYLLLRQSDETPTWLAVEVSEERLKELESHDMEIYQAFTQPENEYLYRFTGDQEIKNVDIVMPGELTEEMLPHQGEYLE